MKKDLEDIRKTKKIKTKRHLIIIIIILDVRNAFIIYIIRTFD